MKLSIIIPAYNEEDTIAELLDRVIAAKLPQGMKREVLVVNDGSTDKTDQVIRRYEHIAEVRSLRQSNAGKTDAVLLGLKESTGDIILIQDADLEYDPEQYRNLVQPIVDGKFKVVYGSRFMGSIKNMRQRIRFVNWCTNWTLNRLFGCRLTDNNTCYKVFKRDILKDITITSTHFGFDCEVTVKLLQKGVTIHEVPIRYVGRTRDEGKKINFFTGFGSYLQIFRYTFLERGR